MNSLRTYRVGISVAIVLLVVVGWFIVKPVATKLPPYLASSAQPDGIKAVLLLLEEKGSQVKEWRQPMHLLPKPAGQALLVVEPDNLSANEQDDLLAWASGGNDLFVFSERPILWAGLPLEAKYMEEKGNQERNVQGQLLAEGLLGQAKTQARWKEAEGLEPLFYDDQGILAGKVQVGAGSISYFLVPDWLTNRKIGELSHFEAVWPHLQKNWSAIWVDEYHHGLQEKPGLLAIYHPRLRRSADRVQPGGSRQHVVEFRFRRRYVELLHRRGTAGRTHGLHQRGGRRPLRQGAARAVAGRGRGPHLRAYRYARAHGRVLRFARRAWPSL